VRATWPRRLGIEVRNVGIAMLASVVALALFVGLVIVVTALSVH
jgi:hypothetical protein